MTAAACLPAIPDAPAAADVVAVPGRLHAPVGQRADGPAGPAGPTALATPDTPAAPGAANVADVAVAPDRPDSPADPVADGPVGPTALAGSGGPIGPADPAPVTVTVTCLATLAAYRPVSGPVVRLPGPAPSVADLAAVLGLPGAKITTILRNGAPADLETPLVPGDAVTFLPTLSGG